MIRCSTCHAPLPRQVFNTGDLAACPSCAAPTRVDVYPAYFGRTASAPGEALSADDEAGCYYHPAKKALVHCSSCGRFLCGLCDVEFGEQHLCPACIETGRRKKKFLNLENRRTLHDSIALSLAILPLLLFWPTIVTAPMSLFLSVRNWNAPTSILPRTKIRFILAIVLSLAQVAGWILFVGFLILRMTGVRG
ncbi:MAG: hypothetical protein OHK006_17270 [Thermodesulfovibrionales bacterium]